MQWLFIYFWGLFFQLRGVLFTIDVLKEESFHLSDANVFFLEFAPTLTGFQAFLCRICWNGCAGVLALYISGTFNKSEVFFPK